MSLNSAYITHKIHFFFPFYNAVTMEMKYFSNQGLLKMAYQIQHAIVCVCQYKPKFHVQVNLHKGLL